MKSQPLRHADDHRIHNREIGLYFIGKIFSVIDKNGVIVQGKVDDYVKQFLALYYFVSFFLFKLLAYPRFMTFTKVAQLFGNAQQMKRHRDMAAQAQQVLGLLASKGVF